MNILHTYLLFSLRSLQLCIFASRGPQYEGLCCVSSNIYDILDNTSYKIDTRIIIHTYYMDVDRMHS